MSTRVHTTEASVVNLSVLDGAAIMELFNLDGYEDVDQALVIEDGGNCEAIVLIGDDDDLLAFAENIRSKVARPRMVTIDRCSHCDRAIILDGDGAWFDPEATGDDSQWRYTCDAHDTFQAEHEARSEA